MKYLRENKILRNCMCIVLSYLSVVAFSYVLKLGKSDLELFSMLDYGYDWLTIFIFGFGIYLISKFILFTNKRIKIYAIVIGFFLSVFSVWGAYLLFVNDIFITVSQGILQFFLVLGLNLFIAPLITQLFVLLKRFGMWYERAQDNKNYTCRNNLVYFLIVWGSIFLCYMPIFLAFWPGNFIYDASYQLSEVVNNAYKTHHPLLHTWLMGKAYRIGLEFGNVSKGFQLYTLFQMLVLSSAFAYCILYLRKKGAPKLFRGISLIWFVLFPMNSIFSITATKDVFFAAFFLYTMIFFLRYFYDKEKFHWYTYVAMILFGALSALFRNNAIYAIVLFCVICFIVTKGWINKSKVVMILLSIYIITISSNQFLIEGLNAYPGAKNRESLSVPLQGLARVAAYRGDELYEYEYNEICMYIREQDIANYSPVNSDPIKNYANEELLETNKLNFLKLWAKIGMQYPDEYIESLVFNTMGYWYLFPMKDYVTMKVSLYHTLIGTEQEIEKESYCDWAEKIYLEIFSAKNYQYTPLLGYSFRIAPYIWFIFLVIFFSIIRKDKKAILIMMLPLSYFGTCLLGPTVAIRYVYCLIVCCPLFFNLLKGNVERKIEESDAG